MAAQAIHNKILFFVKKIHLLALIAIFFPQFASAVTLYSASFSPSSVSAGGSSTLSWSSNGVYCKVDGVTHNGSSGSKVYSNLQSSRNVTVTCSAPMGGSASKVASVTVTIPKPGIPSSLTVSPSTLYTAPSLAHCSPSDVVCQPRDIAQGTVTRGSSSGTVSSYQIERRVNGGSWTSYYTGTANNLTYTFTPGSWQFRIKACNSSGCSDYKYSNTVSVVYPVPGVPTSMSVTPASTTATSVSASWGGAANTPSHYVTRYEAQRRLGSGSWSNFSTSNTTQASSTNMSVGTWSFQVRACNTTGCSAYRAGNSVAILHPVPGIPASITVPALDNDGSFGVSWGTASGHVEHYNLQRRLGEGAWSSNLYSGISQSYSQAGLSNGSYTYKVQACNTTGCSDWKISSVAEVLHPPATPASLTPPASDYDGAFTVSWASTATATSYKLQRKTGSNGTWSLDLYSGSGTGYSQTGLANGTYFYRAQACNAGGCSGWKESASVLVKRTPGIPSSIGIPGSDIDGAYLVTWEVGSGIVESYELSRSTDNQNWSAITLSGVPTSYSETGLGDGTYYYRVRACNSLSCSGWRESVTAVVVKLPPGVPSSINTPSVDGDGSFTVSWVSGSGIVESYKLQRQLGSGNWSSDIYSGSGTSYAQTGLANGSYKYRLQACNTSGCSGWKDSSVVEVVHPPLPPSAFSLPSLDNDGSFTVGWDLSATATSYKLQRKKESAGSWSTDLLPLSGASYSQSGLTDGTYYYQVQACNVGGCSGWTESAGVLVEYIPGVPPSISVPSIDRDGTFTISWDAATGSVTSYNLEEKADSGGWGQLYSGLQMSFNRLGLPSSERTYRVRACNGGSCSDWRTSDMVTVAVSGGDNGLQLSETLSSDGHYSISWDVNTVFGNAILREYFNNSEISVAQLTTSTGTRAYTKTTAGTYSYSIEERDCRQAPLVGECPVIDTIPAKSVEVLFPPQAPASISPSVTSTTNTSVTVSWQASETATEYRLQKRFNGGSWVSEYVGVSTNRTVTNLAPGSWVFQVAAANAAGVSAYTPSVTVAINLVQPASPATVSVDPTSTSGSLSVSWSSSTDATEYRIERVNTQTDTVEASFTRTGSPLTENNIGDGQYTYRVHACNVLGSMEECSAPAVSNMVSVHSSLAPEVVTNLSATNNGNNRDATVTWTSAEVTNFVINRIGQTAGTENKQFTQTSTQLNDSVLPNGTYVYEVVACRTLYGMEKCSSPASSSPLVITAPTEPNYAKAFDGVIADKTLVNSAPAMPAEPVGVLQGAANVSGGSASYSVPIALPPGRNGVQPSVSLSYSSRGGNDTLGVGWSLGAGGGISRCGNTYAQDALTRGVQYSITEDRLCLNGSRLMVVSGTYGAAGAEYRTESDSFVRVTQHSAGINSTVAWFTAEYKDGSVQYFGKNSQSKLIHAGASYPLSWLLEFEHDAVGNTDGAANLGNVPVAAANFIHYDYTTFGEGEKLLTKISYTGNSESDKGDRAVEFIYEPRDDRTVSYLAGGKSETTQRLHKITTKYGLDSVYEYRVGYGLSLASERSLVKSITHCAFEGTWQCLPATRFDWLENSTIAEVTPLKIGGVETFAGEVYLHNVMSQGDVDGDGTRDFIGYNVNAEQDNEGTNDVDVEFGCLRTEVKGRYTCIELDLDSDGINDAFKFEQGKLHVQFSSQKPSSGVHPYVNTNILLKIPSNSATEDELRNPIYNRRDEILTATDVDGDGLQDLVVKYTETGTSPFYPNELAGRTQLRVYLNNGGATATHFATQGADVYTYQELAETVYGCSIVGCGQLPAGGQYDVFTYEALTPIGDYDGNGLTDFIIEETMDKFHLATTYYDPVPVAVLLNKSTPGNLQFERVLKGGFGAGTTTDYGPGEKYFHTYLDVNGDGLSDTLGWSNGQLAVMLNKGDITSNSIVLTQVDNTQSTRKFIEERYHEILMSYGGGLLKRAIVQPKYNDAMHAVDLNGDGRQELVMPGERLISVCSTSAFGFEGTVEKCGDELYGAIQTQTSTYPTTPIGSYYYDDSIYRWDALYFDDDGNGGYTVRKEPTAFVGPAYEVRFFDAFGDGNVDMVSTIGLRTYTGTVSKRIDTANSNSTWLSELASGSNFIAGAYITRNYGSGNGTTTGSYNPVDVMSKATNGFGVTGEWAYRPLSTGDTSVAGQALYSTAHDYVNQSEGYFHFSSSMYVVSNFKQSNGIGGLNETKYAYRGAMYNSKGRGFTGFRSMIREDVANGLVSHTDFHQMFPMVSLVQQQGQFTSDTYGTFGSSNVFGDGAACTISGTSETSLSSLPANASQAIHFSHHCYAQNTAHQMDIAVTASAGGIHSIYATQNQSVMRKLMCDTLPCSLSRPVSIQTSETTSIDKWGNAIATTQTHWDEWGTRVTAASATIDITSTQEAAWWLDKKTVSSVTQDKVTGRHLEDAFSRYSGSETGLDNAIEVETTYSYDTTRSLRIPKQVKVTSVNVNGVDQLASNQGLYSDTVTLFNDYGLPTSTSQTAYQKNTSGQWQLQTRTTTIPEYSTDGYFPRTVTNPLGHSVMTDIDPASGQALSVSRMLDATHSVTVTTNYDPFGRPLAIHTDGAATQYLRYTLPDMDGPTLAALQVTTTQAGTPTSKAWQDKLGRTLRTATQSFAGSWVYGDVFYNARGLVSFESVPSFSMLNSPSEGHGVTYTAYDPLGRLMGKQVSQTCGTLGINTTMTTSYRIDTADPYQTDILVQGGCEGKTLTMSRTYNSLDQLMRTTDAEGGITRYGYNSLGSPVVIEDTQGHPIVALYDGLNRKVKVNDPNQGITHFVYNGFGELQQETRANNKTVNYYLDSLGRVTLRTATGEDNLSYSYDNASYGYGQLYQESGAGLTRHYSYNDKGQPVSTTETHSTGESYSVTSLYDANYGRLKGLEYPNHLTVEYDYNTYGYMNVVKNAATGYVYQEVDDMDQWGNIVGATLGNGIQELAQYSAVNGQALQISALRNLQEILDIQYQMYDGFGNILLEHMQNGAATPDMGDKGGSHNYSEYFVYDDLHRLTHSSFNSFNGTGLDYTYDSGGNLLSKSDYARNYDYTTGTSGGPNAVKRVEKILKQQDGTTQYQWANFGYDARGNMTSGDGLSQAIYNAMDKPTYIEKGGATLSFAYGPSHMRYRQIKVKENITTTTHYVGKLFEKEYREENGVKRESWRAYIGSTAVVSQDNDGFAIRYQHKDRLGSARTFTDANGLVVAQRDYDPFGKPREADGSLKENVWLGGGEQQRPILGDEADAKTRRGFTDHEHLDDVEYIHMNGRVYDYNLGRFLSVDPYIQSPKNSQSINSYSYIMNNPLAGTDPTGYQAECGVGCYSVIFNQDGSSTTTRNGRITSAYTEVTTATEGGTKTTFYNGALSNEQVVKRLFREKGAETDADTETKTNQSTLRNQEALHGSENGLVYTGLIPKELTKAAEETEGDIEAIRVPGASQEGGVKVGDGFLNPANWPTLPDWLVNSAAGFGDGVSFGLTDVVREWMGIDGGVDELSTEYGFSRVAGQLHTSALIIGGFVLRPFTAQTQVVTQWTVAGEIGVNTRWVMTGGNSLRNYIMAGGPQLQASYSQSVTATVAGSSLRYPSGWEAFKGLFGQRMLVP
ncbi:RHS repeat-associated core domain-containing protein [Teredinibacter sp. KSP-S5-2]|uniref:RHS repeat-associated core domain-containing protein n=1 Tax=Teredinibacter sp. KSP-S5-2 TaxID=3034506 RepID=UPI0029343588|nr:RHS repeat-associated core domain-containing protein [Teredinibacter sp. KSP-S5-2]WNO08948.1 RHS repeat-associated core domain-containing protein [Teredinibacter sp. KSP-S5-2]